MRRSCAFPLLVLVLLTAGGCGPRETPEQRVTRLRLAHQVQPTGVQNRTSASGPQLVLDFMVVNTAREPLPTLTVKVVIVDPQGRDRATHLLSLNTAELRPGVATQITGFIPGETLKDGEQVRVEVEGQVPLPARGAYPEYKASP